MALLVCNVEDPAQVLSDRTLREALRIPFVAIYPRIATISVGFQEGIPLPKTSPAARDAGSQAISGSFLVTGY